MKLFVINDIFDAIAFKGDTCLPALYFLLYLSFELLNFFSGFSFSQYTICKNMFFSHEMMKILHLSLILPAIDVYTTLKIRHGACTDLNTKLTTVSIAIF